MIVGAPLMAVLTLHLPRRTNLVAALLVVAAGQAAGALARATSDAVAAARAEDAAGFETAAARLAAADPAHVRVVLDLVDPGDPGELPSILLLRPDSVAPAAAA